MNWGTIGVTWLIVCHETITITRRMPTYRVAGSIHDRDSRDRAAPSPLRRLMVLTSFASRPRAVAVMSGSSRV